jgi:hypothetical protein
MSLETCATCRFFCTDNAGGDRGACHRFPPQIINGRQVRRTNDHPNWQPRPEHYFPMTMRNHWCGEYVHGEQRIAFTPRTARERE